MGKEEAMKRYRIRHLSFDTRALWFTEEALRDTDSGARLQFVAELKHEYGEEYAGCKMLNFGDLGVNPFSILGYHTLFFHQIRAAFIGFAYYPALTGACALGERMLNHMVLTLRDYYRGTPEYKRVYRKRSFDDWGETVSVLNAWGILQPGIADSFRELQQLRNDSVHFRYGLERDSRTPALRAVILVRDIINGQFSALPPMPWFIEDVPGEVYIKKEAEDWPFVSKFYLPYCICVGPYHRVLEVTPQMEFRIEDNHLYENREISDEEFVALRRTWRDGYRP